ncbi:MAG: hypothetical protein IPO92_04195 [Saprospiraceae bacterium]|nr:hypothetical protein [Saprospiraceae bacterium]
MRLKSLLILTFYIFGLNTSVHTQQNSSPRKTSQNTSYSCKVSKYDNNITKLTFQPQAYSKNENLSDAVILKPLNSFITESQESITIKSKKGRKISPTYSGHKDGYDWIEIKLSPTEKIYGGGERALPLNRRGFVFNLENNPWYGYGIGADNLNFSVPFFTSSEGYGLYFDNVSIGKADIGKSSPDVFKIGFKSGELNVYIIPGPTPKEILGNYHKLTGTQGLPPRWALGNFMSRFGYTSEAQVNEIASKMISEKMPFDAVIYDLFWFGDSIKGTLGNLEWVNKSKWPDPKSMISDFKKQNIKTILITEPFMLRST